MVDICHIVYFHEKNVTYNMHNFNIVQMQFSCDPCFVTEREERERIEQEQREEEEREYQERLRKLEEQERKQRARQQEIEERERRREEERRGQTEEKPKVAFTVISYIHIDYCIFLAIGHYTFFHAWNVCMNVM